jgi:hypothetical protein
MSSEADALRARSKNIDREQEALIREGKAVDASFQDFKFHLSDRQVKAWKKLEELALM